MIHAYLTNGFFEMAKVFLESYEAFNGGWDEVVLSTRDLTQDQIDELKKKYPKLKVENKIINMAKLATYAGIDEKTLRGYRQEVESNYVSNKNRVWKLMIAADDRVKALFGLLQRVKYQSVVLHFDIDTMFRKSVMGLRHFAESCDLGIKYRPNFEPIKGRITIDLITITKVKSVMLFFQEWIKNVDNIKPLDRPIGWGQTSCYYAFQKFEDQIKWKTLPLIYGLPGRNKEEDVVWCGNVHRLKKSDCVDLFKNELERVKAK